MGIMNKPRGSVDCDVVPPVALISSTWNETLHLVMMAFSLI